MVDHDREVAVGIDDQARLALRELGERAGARQSPAVHHEDATLGDTGGVQVELGRVQLDVPEPVGRGHASAHGAGGHHRPGNIEALERRGIQRRPEIAEPCPGGEMRGRRCEDIPAVERARDRREQDVGAPDLHGVRDSPERVPRERQHAVVGTD